jgi:hypothetical protein
MLGQTRASAPHNSGIVYKSRYNMHWKMWTSAIHICGTAAFSTNPSVLLTLIAVFLALLTSSETERYYCRLGMKPLIECDSIVTVKFDPNIPGIRCEDFAFRIECLDENYFSFHSRFDLKMTLIERSPTCSG